MFRFLSVPGAMAILVPRALILTPWARTVVLPMLAQVSEYSRCGGNPSTQGANPNTLGDDGGVTKACSGF